MRLLLNLIWLVLSGIWMAIAYLLAGVLMCITIIGIPFGLQAFKLGGFALWPFGRALVRRARSAQGRARDRATSSGSCWPAGGSRSATCSPASCSA